MGTVLNAASFDMVYVQFCEFLVILYNALFLNAGRFLDNNYCGLNEFSNSNVCATCFLCFFISPDDDLGLGLQHLVSGGVS